MVVCGSDSLRVQKWSLPRIFPNRSISTTQVSAFLEISCLSLKRLSSPCVESAKTPILSGPPFFLLENCHRTVIIMSKRHNRKRTRSRPRHRDGGAKAAAARAVSLHNPFAGSMDMISSSSPAYPTNFLLKPSSFPFAFPISFPLSALPTATDIWPPTYSSAWHTRLQLEQERALEVQRLRFFGGEVGDESSLFEPMLKVVTDLFDGEIDYEDP